jgi:glucokinase
MDIGGTKCAVCLADADGRIRTRREFATQVERGPEAILSELEDTAEAILQETSTGNGGLIGIGVSCGGPLDPERGVIQLPPNLPLWDNVPVRAALESRFPGVQVRLENDANATALAEWRLGAGRGCRNMAFMTVGTGVGGGLILEGRIYRGTSFLAGEIGHTTVLRNGPLCRCGKRGCLEALASGPGVAALAQESVDYGRGRALMARVGGKKASITARDVVECAKEGDAFCAGILEEAGTYLGLGIANLLMILNLERVVLGTLAVHAGELLLKPVREAVSVYAWKPIAEVCSIVPAELGDRAQDLAAVSLWMQDP